MEQRKNFASHQVVMLASIPQDCILLMYLNQLIILIISVFIIFRLAGEYSLRIYFNLYLNNAIGIDLADIAFLFSVAQFISLGGPLISLLLMNRFEEEKVFTSATFFLGLAAACAEGILTAQCMAHCLAEQNRVCGKAINITEKL